MYQSVGDTSTDTGTKTGENVGSEDGGGEKETRRTREAIRERVEIFSVS